MKKLSSLLLAIVLFCVSAARAGSVPLDEIIGSALKGGAPAAEVSHTALVYLGTLLSPLDMKVWHASSWEDVPFVSVTDTWSSASP